MMGVRRRRSGSFLRSPRRGTAPHRTHRDALRRGHVSRTRPERRPVVAPCVRLGVREAEVAEGKATLDWRAPARPRCRSRAFRVRRARHRDRASHASRRSTPRSRAGAPGPRRPRAAPGVRPYRETSGAALGRGPSYVFRARGCGRAGRPRPPRRGWSRGCRAACGSMQVRADEGDAHGGRRGRRRGQRGTQLRRLLQHVGLEGQAELTVDRVHAMLGEERQQMPAQPPR